MGSYTKDIFICYSEEDRKWVKDWLLDRLEAVGLSVFFDERDYTIGAPKLVNMENAIRDCEYILIILSPNWLKGKWTEFQTLLAQTGDACVKEGRLVPLMLKECDPPQRLDFLEILDFKEKESRLDGLARIIRQIRPEALEPSKTNPKAANPRETREPKPLEEASPEPIKKRIAGWPTGIIAGVLLLLLAWFLQDWKMSSGQPWVGEEAGQQKIIEINGVSLAFRWIPRGAFVMGEGSVASAETSDVNPFQVTLTNGFWMAEHETTQALWFAVMGTRPSHFRGDNRPVEQVSWEQVQVFLQKINKLGIGTFRLPTEAQWEYAARAGGRSQNTAPLVERAWFAQNSNKQTQTVAGKQPNTWGLKDMQGNVWEWTNDWYAAYPTTATSNPTGPAQGKERIIRGGSWGSDAAHLEITNRNSTTTTGATRFLGFRLVKN